jgi:hypothetical protein
MTQTTTLAAGHVTASDSITIELVAPQGQPQAILVRWPEHPTVVQPRRYADCASAIMRLLALANVELTRIRARRL